MSRGRPNISEQLVLDYVEHKPDRFLDLQLDAGPLAEYARRQGQRPPRLSGVIQRMRKKGRVHTLQRGRYLVYKKSRPQLQLDALDPVADAILRRLNMDYYISWHSALWHHGLIDQQSRRILVAVTRRKRSARIRMWEVRFVTVVKRKFFGCEQIEDFDWPIWMATVEKALIDSFDRHVLVGPMPVVANALRRAWQDNLLDPDRLVAESIRFGSPTLNRRLGFFMELFGIPGWEPLTLRVGRKYAAPLAPGFEPAKPQPVNPRWRVYEDPTIIGAAEELK